MKITSSLPEEHRPNLFLVGAMKSGTTSLHHCLSLHPEIYMSCVKEPAYFTQKTRTYSKLKSYEALFTGGKNAKYRGESSTHYTKVPRFSSPAADIYEYSPSAKIIYIMRDPVDRIISHYHHWCRNPQAYTETRDIVTAIREEPLYLSFSSYAFQLHPYIQKFGRAKIYLMIFENFIRNTQEEMNKLFTWLGVEEFSYPEKISAANVAPEYYRYPRSWSVARLEILIRRILKLSASPTIATEKRTRAVINSNERMIIFDYIGPAIEEQIKDLAELDCSAWTARDLGESSES